MFLEFPDLPEFLQLLLSSEGLRMEMTLDLIELEVVGEDLETLRVDVERNPVLETGEINVHVGLLLSHVEFQNSQQVLDTRNKTLPNTCGFKSKLFRGRLEEVEIQHWGICAIREEMRSGFMEKRRRGSAGLISDGVFFLENDFLLKVLHFESDQPSHFLFEDFLGSPLNQALYFQSRQQGASHLLPLAWKH